ncbi:branched-chain amino acid ABC transporter substrate-binding protein [Halovulum sp. GXIMD14793]
MKRFLLASAVLTGSAIGLPAQDISTMTPEEIIAASETASFDKTVRIAFIDPLSGPFGPVGDASYKQFRLAADFVNAAGGMNGHRVEVVAYDNKISPKESLVQLQKAIDDGIRIVAQGNSSSVAHALSDAIAKHNRRNPGEEVLLLNYAAVDPALTGEACNYWHFRFDANTNMKMAAITDWMAAKDDMKKVYIIGQDYSHGKAVAAAAVSMLTEKRPDIEVVGNELHPIGKVQDFAPYVQKIAASDADAIITGNWGTDMTLLVKAANDAGLEIPIITFYAGGLGSPTAMGEGAVDKVIQITEIHENLELTPQQVAVFDWFWETHGAEYYYLRVDNLMQMLDAAAEKAGAVDAASLAAGLEGMTYEGPYGTVTMQTEDHQAVQPLFLSVLSDDAERKVEGTPYGFETIAEIAGKDTIVASDCKMKRP